MQTEEQITQLTAKRAAEWMETLRADTHADRVAFDAWLRESRSHLEQFLELEALDRQVRALDAADRPDIEGMIAGAATTVRPLRQRPWTDQAPTRGRRRFRPLAAAAALALLSWVGYFVLQTSTQQYTTRVGEQRSLTLADGSQIHMNVDTVLKVNYSDRERGIRLTSGEAIFEVANDPARPFIVHTPTADVRALGTQFNVYQRNTTVVSVLQGRVQVKTGARDSRDLAAGEEVQIARGRIQPRAHPDASKTAAWRQGRLYVDEMPLAEIVREFNRHGGPVRLRLEGIPAGAYRFGGTFDADDPAAFVDLLERQSDLQVQRAEGEIVIRGRD